MILKSKIPNRIVQRRVRKPGGRKRIVPLFRFDENGLAEIDETKLTATDIKTLTTLFEVVDDVKEHKVDGKVNLSELSYQELKKTASEKGINTYRKGKDDLIAELEA